MGGYLALWPFALRRLRHRWKLMLPLLTGAILAVALLSSVVIYGDAVRGLGLRHALSQLAPEKLDVDLLAYNAPIGSAAYASLRGEVEGASDRNLAWFTQSRVRGMKSATMFVNAVGRDGASIDLSPEAVTSRDVAATHDSPRLRSVFAFQEGFTERTTVMSGNGLPDITVASGPGNKPADHPEIPAWITEATAQEHRLKTGDRVIVTPFWQSSSPYVSARIVGVVRAKDPAGRFWTTHMHQEIEDLRDENYIPLYVSEKTFQMGVAKLLPEMLADYHWAVLVDTAKIRPDSAALAAFGLDGMGRQLQTQLGVGYLQRTSLDQVLKQFGVKDVFGRIPLLIVTIMIVAVIVYYLVLVANIVVQQHIGETALLRSRGADPPQLLALCTWEAVFLGVIAFATGPFLAWGATSTLGYTAVFSGLTKGSALPAQITPEVIFVALLGSLVAVIALLLPTLKATSLEIPKFRLTSSRPVTDSVFTRYYLDIFTAVIGAVLFWEMTQRGGLVTTTLKSGTQVDQVLLAAPALILSAVALLFLRVFPVVMKAMAWMAGRFGSLPILLSLRQVGRNPLPFALPVLLLMLASSIAMFAANFGATVNRSYTDRAAYAAGSPLRIQGTDSVGPPEGLAPQNSQEVLESRAFRSRTAHATQLFASDEFALLAIDPATFGKVAWYRKDFSGKPLGAILETLATGSSVKPHGIPIPPDATALGVWVRPAVPQRRMLVSARIADARGHYEEIPLGDLGKPDWTFLSAPLPTSPKRRGPALQVPFRLVALHLSQVTGDNVDPGALYLDLVQATGPSAGPITLVDLRQAGSAAIRDKALGSVDSLATNHAVVRSGQSTSSVLIWGGGSPLTSRGIAFSNTTPLDKPLQAVVSRTFVERQKTALGDQTIMSVAGHSLPIKIVEVVDFFPTLDPYNDGFMVLNLHAVMERLNTISAVASLGPNERWLASTGSTSNGQRANIIPAGTVVDRDKLLESFAADPLTAAGWNGLLSMAFLAVLFTTLVGFSVYSLVQAQGRRAEFALLRSMGISLGALTGVVLVEQLLVIIIGLALGSLMGIMLTAIIMPFLGLNEAGSRVLPPFVVQVDWQAVGIVYGSMALAFLIATGALIRTFSRAAIHQALRFGDA